MAFFNGKGGTTFEDVTVEHERGRTYSSDTFAIYGYALESRSSVNYRGPGTTYRCYLAGGFETPEAAKAVAEANGYKVTRVYGGVI